MRALRALAIFIAVILAIPVLYMFCYQGAWVPFRLTIEVETPEGLKTGSGIWAGSLHKEPQILPGVGDILGGAGEAIPVDLGPRGTMYVIYARRLGGSPNWLTPIFMLLEHFADEHTQGYRPSYAVRRIEGKAELSVNEIPFLVRFRDESDPMTVEAVDPENLAASFGAGVYLKRATIEVLPKGWWPFNTWGFTGTPLTRGIENRLPWLKSLKGNLNGSKIFGSRELSNRLERGHFITRGMR